MNFFMCLVSKTTAVGLGVVGLDQIGRSSPPMTAVCICEIQLLAC